MVLSDEHLQVGHPTRVTGIECERTWAQRAANTGDDVLNDCGCSCPQRLSQPLVERNIGTVSVHAISSRLKRKRQRVEICSHRPQQRKAVPVESAYR